MGGRPLLPALVPQAAQLALRLGGCWQQLAAPALLACAQPALEHGRGLLLLMSRLASWSSSMAFRLMWCMCHDSAASGSTQGAQHTCAGAPGFRHIIHGSVLLLLLALMLPAEQVVQGQALNGPSGPSSA